LQYVELKFFKALAKAGPMELDHSPMGQTVTSGKGMSLMGSPKKHQLLWLSEKKD